MTKTWRLSSNWLVVLALFTTILSISQNNTVWADTASKSMNGNDTVATDSANLPSGKIDTILAGNASLSSNRIVRFEAGAQVGNPAGAYCSQVMGYSYEIQTNSDGSQDGFCVLPNQDRCEQWDFYAGKCGQNFSVCARDGLNTVAQSDGADPYSTDYSVCADPQTGKIVESARTLSGTDAKIGSKLVTFQAKTSVLTMNAAAGENVSTSLPASFDWRNYKGANWMTPVKNQGGCGSCWAFAPVAVVESYEKIKANNSSLSLDLSEQDVLNCSNSGNCKSGGESNGALDYVFKNGIVDEACNPYNAADKPCGTGRCTDYQSHKSTIGPVIDSFSTKSRDQIKQQVQENGPAVVYMGIDSDFGGGFDAQQVYRCSKDSQSAQKELSVNHAVTLVGWDDAGQYWILKNSWGTSWNRSMGGYFKLGYGECNAELYDVINIQHSADSVLTDQTIPDQSNLPAPTKFYHIYLPTTIR